MQNASAVAWRTAALLACAASLNYADRTSISSVFPLLKADLGLTDIQLAAIGSFFLWSYAAGSPFAGFLADRLPRGKTVAVSLLAWSLVTLWTGFARSSTELLLSRVVLGIAECAYLPAAVALIADHHPASTRGRAMAVHLVGLNAGLVGGGALAGYLGDIYGWRASLFVLGAAGVLLSGVCALVLREGPGRNLKNEPTKPLKPQLQRLLGSPGYLYLAAQAMVVSVGTWMFFNWMPLYFRETFGLSLALAGFSGTAVLQVSAVAGAVIGGFLSDAAEKREPNGGRLRLMLICYIICAPCLLIFLTGQGILAVSLAVVAFSLFRSTATASETPTMCDLVDAGDRSTGQALMNTANTIAGGAGVFVAGYLKADWGLGGVFAGVSGLMFVAVGLVWAAWRLQVTARRDTFSRTTHHA
jgi:predicted MFS family arabinose efflux permease